MEREFYSDLFLLQQHEKIKKYTTIELTFFPIFFLFILVYFSKVNTVYLTKLDRANNGKREEIKDRVKHGVTE